MRDGLELGIGVVGGAEGLCVGIAVGSRGLAVGVGVGTIDGIVLGPGDGINDGF